jgi:hypothetical protein
MAIRPPGQTTERLGKGEGEELVRRALEDGVIAHERSPGIDVGWSIADLAADLGCSDTHATRIIRREHNVHLRAGQIRRLRPRIKAAVLAALGLDQAENRDVQSHVRRVSARVGALNALLDRFLSDKVIDPKERAQLRAEFRSLASEALAGADDLGESE